MKAKVIATGEVLKVADRSLNLEYVWCCKEDGSIIRYKSEEVELIIEKKIDWEQRRFELVKAAMQGVLANPITKNVDNKLIDNVFLVADAVIKDLKEK